MKQAPKSFQSGVKPVKIATPASKTPAAMLAGANSKSPHTAGKAVSGFSGSVKSGKVKA